MAQYTVYRNKSPKSKAEIPFFARRSRQSSQQTMTYQFPTNIYHIGNLVIFR